MFSFSKVLITVMATAQAKGLPAKVEPCLPIGKILLALPREQ